MLLNNDSIEYVGTKAFQADAVIDAAGGIVLPGLVNAHTHLPMTLLRSYASHLPLQAWLEKVWEAEDKLTDEDIYAGTLLACAEALETGTACVQDMYFRMHAVARACAETGIRAYLGRCLMDNAGQLQKNLYEAEALHKLWNGYDGGRIQINTALHAEYTCSQTAYQAAFSQAAKTHASLHLHLSETVEEVAGSYLRHGCSPVEWLDKQLPAGQKVLAAHCVALNSADIETIARRGIVPVHNPGSNLKLASGISPVPEMLKRGIPVAMGTDGAASNNNLDMFRELYLGAVLHKAAAKNAEAVTPFQAVSMATKNGASALGYSGGVIEPGAKADLLVLYNHYNLQPAPDLYATICYSAQSRNVRYNIVNGQVLVQEGACVSVDRHKLQELLQASIQRLWKGKE